MIRITLIIAVIFSLQELESKQRELSNNHERAVDQLAEQHKRDSEEHIQATKKKLLFEYSKQDKLEAKICSLQEIMVE